MVGTLFGIYMLIQTFGSFAATLAMFIDGLDWAENVFCKNDNFKCCLIKVMLIVFALPIYILLSIAYRRYMFTCDKRQCEDCPYRKIQ